jgi:hypothetical protein
MLKLILEEQDVMVLTALGWGRKVDFYVYDQEPSGPHIRSSKLPEKLTNCEPFKITLCHRVKANLK